MKRVQVVHGSATHQVSFSHPGEQSSNAAPAQHIWRPIAQAEYFK